MQTIAQVRQCLQGIDPGSIQLVDLRLPDVGHAAQVVITLPDLLTQPAPRALRALRTGYGIGRRWIAQLRFKKARLKRVVVADVIGDTISKPGSITQDDMHRLRHAALPLGQDR